jgi:hypothetical protein
VALDDPAALTAALAGVHLVLNAAGPFLRTAAPLAEACLAAGVHYCTEAGSGKQASSSRARSARERSRSSCRARRSASGSTSSDPAPEKLPVYRSFGCRASAAFLPHYPLGISRAVTG